jgi:hypothetical protein
MVAANERFLLFAAPVLDLPFCGNRIFDPLKILVEYEAGRAAACGVTIECAGLMLADPLFEAAARCSNKSRQRGAG